MDQTPAAAPEVLDRLDPELAEAVTALAARAAAADGTPPLSEEARLALRARRPQLVHLVVRGEDDVVAYAQLSSHEAPATQVVLELVVDPARRGAGVGTGLLAAAQRAAAALSPTTAGDPAPDTSAGTAPHPAPQLLAWSHGDSPAATALALRGGWRRTRELWRMGRSLSDSSPALAPVELPAGVALRSFEVGRDDEAWLDLNARAFAAHPEQGRWTLADLAARQGEEWFRAQDLLLAVDTATGELLASHWTKVEGPVGEVYVVAVAPGAQGRGLGRVVVLAGLHHLRGRGVEHVDLYVEGDNARARALYTRLGFERTGLDVQHSLP